MRVFDLIVIGGGSGGIATARRAALHGAKVLLVEGGVIGGTCVNVGCVPKKVMWNASMLCESLELHAGYGLSDKNGAHETASTDVVFPKLKAGRDAYIHRLNAIYDRNLASSQVERVAGWAQLAAGGEGAAPMVVVGEQNFVAQHILIATGGRPLRQDVPGSELLSTSDDFFAWEELPKKVAVFGAGYIAVELAGMMRALGCEVHLCLRRQGILKAFDGEVAARLLDHMIEQGVLVHKEVSLREVRREASGALTVELTSGAFSGFDQVLTAIGRVPNTDLNLAAVGVRLTATGHIQIDAYQNTTAPGIYAIGDVTGKVELTPVAIAAGRRLAERLFNGKSEAKLNYDNIPTVVFSHPPMGSVGLSEEDAAAQYGSDGIQVYRSNFVNMLYALTEAKPKTLMKIITRRKDDLVLGMHVLGVGADEMIQGFAVAVKMGAKKSDLDATMAIHPTAAEEFVTM